MKEIISVATKFKWTKETLLQWGDLVFKKFEADCLQVEVAQDEKRFTLDKQFVLHTMGRLEDQNLLIRNLLDTNQQLQKGQSELISQLSVLKNEIENQREYHNAHMLSIQNMFQTLIIQSPMECVKNSYLL